MCAFWLNTYRCEKYEHFWPSFHFHADCACLGFVIAKPENYPLIFLHTGSVEPMGKCSVIFDITLWFPKQDCYIVNIAIDNYLTARDWQLIT